MSFYLNSFKFKGKIKKENVDKLTDDFYDYFETIEDDNGDIIDIYCPDLKFNFENVVLENVVLFEPGSTMDMTDEYSSPFRWRFDGKTYKEYNGYVIYPETPEEIAMVERLEESIN